MPELTRLKVPTPDGILWHCLRYGSGPDLVLLPSGEGDTHTFATLLHLLSPHFTLTTFDMPGFSRSTCPPSALESLSASKLASQIISLLDTLSIPLASFYGCSSGGLIALALVSEYPDRVRNVIVHEVPLEMPKDLRALKRMSEEDLAQACRKMFATEMCEDEAKWDGMGKEYHKRLERNYVTWARHYLCHVERGFDEEELRRRPVMWTIGGLTPAGVFWGKRLSQAAFGYPEVSQEMVLGADMSLRGLLISRLGWLQRLDQSHCEGGADSKFVGNVVQGFTAGIHVGLLPCKHFPQVTVPEVLAAHIRGAVEQNL